MEQKPTREKILEAAREVFAEQGFLKASVESVARKAGVSKTLVFWYFKNKENLIEEVAKTITPDKIISNCVTDNIKGKELLRCVVESYYNFFSDEKNKKLALHMLDLAMIDPKFRVFYDSYCNKELAKIVSKITCSDEDAVLGKMLHGMLFCPVLENAPKEKVLEYVEKMFEPLIKCE